MACDYLFLLDRTPEAILAAIPEVAATLALADVASWLGLPDPANVLLVHDEIMLLFDVTQENEPGGGGLAQASLNWPMDNDGAALTTGVVGTLELYQAVTILAASLTADQVGSLVVDVKVCSFTNYPSGLASITGSTPPTLSSAQKVEDTTLTGWTTTIGPGIIQVSVVSAATITRATLSLHLGL